MSKFLILERSLLSHKHDNGTQVQCLALIAKKVYHARIREKTGISQSGQSKLRKKALERGWDPDKPILLKHVTNASKSGRPLLTQEVCDKVIKVVTKNSTTRQYSCAQIAEKVSENLRKEGDPKDFDILSASSVYRILSKNGYGN